MQWPWRQKGQAQPGERIWELDFLRGLCVILMILDHISFDLATTFYDLASNYGTDTVWYRVTDFMRYAIQFSVWRPFIRYTIIVLFIALCGVSCSFSRSNWRRGWRLLLLAMALTLITWAMDFIFKQDNFFIIRFGILHVLACSILFYALLARTKRWLIPVAAGIALLASIYFAVMPMQLGSPWASIIFDNIGQGFYSADYFPLLPWLGVFLMSAALGPLLYKEKKSYLPQLAGSSWIKPFCFTGRHALLIYVLHQPVVYFFLGILLVLSHIFGLA